MKKIKNLSIEICNITKAFFKAIKNIPRKQQEDSTFVGLNPIKNADENGVYGNAIEYALNNPEITNIAITGNYGAGKSSVIKTFFSKLENQKYNPVYISLASFKSEDELNKDIDNENEFYHSLEKSILQQLFYRENPKKIPLSRFKRINKHSKLYIILLLCILILSVYTIVELLKPSLVTTVIDNFKNYRWSSKIMIILCLNLVGLIIYCTYKGVFLLTHKMNIDKFKIDSIEIEVNNKTESIFNKYLEEIIYYFQVTKHKVVIIEDLDRYNEGRSSDVTIIFQKLKELNTLINTSNQVKYEVDFIYAIKDDFFNSAEKRTKFFDYTIPIIPIASNVNSNELIWNRLVELLSKGKLKFNFNKDFINTIAIYIDSKRLIDSIINEFLIYKGILTNLANIDDKKLFSIIAYKNMYPDRYSDLQNGKGKIIDIFNRKKTVLDEKIEDLSEKISNANELKRQMIDEKLQDIVELKYVLLGNILDYKNVNYNTYFTFSNKSVNIREFMEKTDIDNIKSSRIEFKNTNGWVYEEEIFKYFNGKDNFIKRWERIENYTQKKLEEIELSIKMASKMIQEMNSMSLKDLVTKHSLQSLFLEEEKIEKFFILNGFITEDYKHYITIFVAGDITIQDFDFILSVKNGQPLPYDYNLEHVDNIVKRLDDTDYTKREILNLDLLNYFIENNMEEEKVIKMINILDRTENMINFVDLYLEKYNDVDKFIKMITITSKKLWKKVYEKIGDYNYIDKWIIRFLLNELSLKNVDDDFQNYISNHASFDKCVKDDEIAPIIDSLKILTIKFNNINKINNKKFIEQVYINNMYELNNKMIKLMFELNSIYLKESQETCLTEIIENKNLARLKEYVLENFKEFYNLCYLSNDIHKNSETAILEILNNENIDFDIKKSIIKNEMFNQYNFEDLNDFELQNTIIELDKLNIDYRNVLFIYKRDGKLNEIIIKHISKHIDDYAKLNVNDCKGTYDSMVVDNFKLAYIASSFVEKTDFKVLVKTFDIKIHELVELDSERVDYLIHKNMIEFNQINYDYIKQDNNELYEIVVNNKVEFLSNIEKYDINPIMNELLVSKSFSNEEKNDIINEMNRKNISLDKLKNTTLLYLVKNKLIKPTEEAINKAIIEDENISFDEKLDLLEIIMKPIHKDREKCFEYLHVLAPEYKDIEVGKRVSRLKLNSRNKRLCEILDKCIVISSFELNDDSITINHYRK